MESKLKRDVEKGYSKAEFAAKLRRLADAIENGKRFEIRIAGERIHVPVRAGFTIEHERSEGEEEIEFQIKWKREQAAERPALGKQGAAGVPAAEGKQKEFEAHEKDQN